MKVISRRPIVTFSRAHPGALAPLDHWYRTTLRAVWKSLTEMRRTFPHADPVGRLTVFNVGGGKYRVIARVNHHTQKVFVRAILTHGEYDRGGWKE
jgi:mRNA interferase HigB